MQKIIIADPNFWLQTNNITKICHFFIIYEQIKIKCEKKYLKNTGNRFSTYTQRNDCNIKSLRSRKQNVHLEITEI